MIINRSSFALRRSKTFTSSAKRSMALWCAQLKEVEEKDFDYVVDLYKRHNIIGDNKHQGWWSSKDVRKHLAYLLEFQPNTHPGYVIEVNRIEYPGDIVGRWKGGYLGKDVWHRGNIDGIVRENTSGCICYMEAVLETGILDSHFAAEAVQGFLDKVVEKDREIKVIRTQTRVHDEALQSFLSSMGEAVQGFLDKVFEKDREIKVVRTQTRVHDEALQSFLSSMGFEKLDCGPEFDPLGENDGTVLFEKYDGEMVHFDWLNPTFSSLRAK